MLEPGSPPSVATVISRRWAQGRRIVLRRRRLVSALLTGGAALAAVHIWAPPAPVTTDVVAAAHDLPAGVILTLADLHVVHVDPAQLPAGVTTSTTQLVGQTLAGPMRSGELFTDVRVVGRGLLGGYPDSVEAMPLRVSDGDVVRLLHVGDHVDVLAATGHAAGDADLVAADAPVVAVPAPTDQSHDGALVVLALAPSQVSRLAQAAATTQLTVVLRD